MTHNKNVQKSQSKCALSASRSAEFSTRNWKKLSHLHLNLLNYIFSTSSCYITLHFFRNGNTIFWKLYCTWPNTHTNLNPLVKQVKYNHTWVWPISLFSWGLIDCRPTLLQYSEWYLWYWEPNLDRIEIKVWTIEGNMKQICFLYILNLISWNYLVPGNFYFNVIKENSQNARLQWSLQPQITT